MSPSPHSVPRGFRTRALIVLLAAGLLPTVLLGVAGRLALEGALSVSLSPLEHLLDRVDAQLARTETPDSPLREELAEARLHVTQAELARGALLRRAPQVFAALLIAVALASAVTAWLIGRRLARPVEQLAQGMARFAAGDDTVRLPAASAANNELQYLIHEFNRMVPNRAAQRERLSRAEQLAAWQDVARALAHELKNPLTAMRLALGRLDRVDASAEGQQRLRESSALLAEELTVLARMTQSFSTFARLPTPVLAPLELSALLSEVCALYGEGAAVPIRLEADGPQRIAADAGLLRSVFGNLVKNALEACAQGERPVKVRLCGEGSFARVEVSDEGTGIAERWEGAALTRGLVSTKPQGAGLGLPIAAKIVHDHRGRIWLEPRAPRGTLAVVELPREPA